VAEGPYKIGALLDVTGAYSALGETEREALQGFVKQINENGGVNGRDLELEIVDSRTDETEAVNGLRGLAEDGVVAVIGPSGTSTGTAVRPISASLELPMIVPASGTSIVQPLPEAKWIFKNFPDAQYGREALTAFAEELGASSVAGIAPNNTYGQDALQDLEGVAEEAGLTFAGAEMYEPGSTDFVPQLTKLKASAADAILVMDVPPATSIIAKNADQVDLGETHLLFDVGSAGQQFIETAGTAAEGKYVVGTKALVTDAIPQSDPQYEAINAYSTNYTKATGKEPNQYSGLAWDALQLIVRALEENESATELADLRSGIRDSLEATQGYVGVLGEYNYSDDDHSGQDAGGLALLQVRDGKFTLAGSLTADGGVQLLE
jgi:branched-chain amino acid transport system substrate-binding protein